jgi:seryl-tRNA synthetase
MTLYEINKAIEDAILNIYSQVDEETGEVSDDAMQALTDLRMARDEKLENIGCVIKNKKAEAKAIKEEVDALTKRKKAIDRETAGLENYVSMMLNGQPFESPKVKFSFRESEQVIIDDDKKLARSWFRKAIKFEPNKDAIKAAIKAGKKVRFAHIEKVQNLQIK